MNNNSFLKHIFFLILFTLTYLLIDIIIYKPYYFITSFLAFLNILLFLWSPKKGILMFLPFMLLSDVMSKYDIRSSGAEIASIHTMYIGPFNLFTYMVGFFAFISILFSLLNRGRKQILTKVDKGVFVIFLICILTAIVGLPNIFLYPREYIGDIAPFINLFAGFIITRVFVRDLTVIDNLIWILLYTFGARSLIGLIRFFMGIGYDEAYVLIPFYDPIGSFSLFVIFTCLAFILYGNVSKSTKHFSYLLILMGLSFMIMWPGRSQWIFAFLGILFVSLFMKLKKKLSYLITVLILLIGVTATLYTFEKDLVAYSIWRLSTMQYLIQGTEGPSTTAIRFVEYANAFYKLKEEGRLLWGAGAGSWFDDKYVPFPFVLAKDDSMARSAFGEKELQEWKFFRLHELLPNIFFKSGFLGLFLYFLSIGIITIELYKKAMHQNYGIQKSILVGFCAPLLFLLIVGFVSKNMVMAGILLGIIVNILKIGKEETND